jgi:hypothetical protein
MLDLAVAVEALPAESFGSSYTTFEQTKTAVADGSVPSPDGNERNIPVRFELVQVRRYAPDGSYQIEDTFTEATPVGDASTAEEAFLAAIYPVGETETATLPPGSANLDRFDTSGTVDEVRNRIDEAISQSGDVKADHAAQVLDFVEALYASQLLEPSDRATLIEIIATTPGVRISEPGADLVTAATLYTAPEGFDAELRLTFVSTGWLRESTRSAVGTYQPWQLAPGDSFATVSYSVPTASR